MKSEIKPISGYNDRVKLADVVPLKTPFTFNIFPTNSCNFRCNYCAQSLGFDYLKTKYQFKPQNLTLDTFKLSLEQMKDFAEPFKLVSFMGHGEPLLNKDLPAMIKLIKESGVAKRIEIITNASLLTHELSKALIEAGLSTIRVSLQGIRADKYKEISGVDLDFAKFIDELSYFYSIKQECKLYVKTVDTSLDAGEEDLFYQLFSNISDRMYIEKVKPVYNGVNYTEQAADVTVDRYGNEHSKRFVCPFPFYSLSLWPNGDIVPCDAIYKPVILGNVHNEDLLSMWNGEKLRDFRKMQLKKQRMDDRNCSQCCAPDDVSHHLDDLDKAAEDIYRRIK